MEVEVLEKKSTIYYCFRMKHWNHMLTVAKEGLSRFKGDSSFHLYSALALILKNRLEEGIHELESISAQDDVKLSVAIALIYAHKELGIGNRELFTKLEEHVKDYRKSCEPSDYYLSAFVLLCFNKLEKALDYAEKAVSIQSSSAEFLTLKGWILIEMGTVKPGDVKELFHAALQINHKYLDAILGYTECCIYQNEISEAMKNITKAVVCFLGSNLPLIQKFRIQLASLNWDQAEETLHRIIEVDSKNVYGRKMIVVFSLCRHFPYDEAVTHMKQFAKTLETTESCNIELTIECTDLFTKISDNHPDVQLENVRILERALKKQPENIRLIIEMGYQFFSLNKFKDAIRYFKSALAIDDSSFKALLGLTLCEYAENGISDQLQKQIHYLKETKYASDSSQLHFLITKVCDSFEDKIMKLCTICERKLLLLKRYPFSDVSLSLLEPNIMLDVIQEYINEVCLAKQNKKGIHDSVHNMLNLILKWCPKSGNALFLLAKLLYIKGDETNALRTLEKLLKETDDPITEAQLLMAQIEVERCMFEKAASTLEACVSSNFEVRESPLYHYIAGLVDKNTGNFADAIKSFSTCMNLINTKGNGENIDMFYSIDKGTVFVEMIDTLHIIGQNEEAERVLEEATDEMKDNPNQSMILLLSADHAMNRNNIQEALDLISRIKQGDPWYTEAKARQANILLDYRRDKYAYISLFQEIVNENPNSGSYVLLGDAYMKILEPEDALEWYEKALREFPDHPNLMSKMGKSLIETHYFVRAVKYYEETITKTNDPNLKLELAELYMNLKQYEKGELILLNEIEQEQKKIPDDILDYLRHETKLFMLLAQIQEKSGNLTYALKSLRDAMDSQSRLRKRIAIEQNVVPDNEIEVLVAISIKMGDMAIALKNNEQALNYYREGLEESPDNTTILVAAAKLYMQMNYLDRCQETCAKILELEPENDSASVMMADIAFRQVDFDMALYHFTQLVNKQPSNYEALVRLIEILRRTGNIENALEFLNTTEKFVGNPTKDTHFLYCKALYQMYSGNLNAALRNFNFARDDVEFGRSAINNMIEICLNPDDEMVAEPFLDTDDIEYRDSRSMALRTADRLLIELKLKLGTTGDDNLQCRVLSNFCLLATKDRHSIESALEDFVVLASDPVFNDNISVILGLATSYTLLKQSQRAKNQLKRVNKAKWNFDDAEYLERCWLLLADYYIQSAKYEVASELINKVLKYNKSCIKACECLGYIGEKEQHYKEAVRHYEQAWKYGGKSNPAVGFKLGYSLMKCKRYPEAINLAHAVLKLNPEYPRVKKDILDKSINNLRI